MKILDYQFEKYKNLIYEKVNGTRFLMKDLKSGKEMEFNLKGIDSERYLPMDAFQRKLESMNDYKYTEGYGFYLNGSAEFAIGGFLRGGGCAEFEKEKLYCFGKYEFEVSPPTDLFRYLTWADDESKDPDFDTIKLTGVAKDTFVIDIEKAILYLGTNFKLDYEEEYGQFHYPQLMDLREAGMLYEPFDYTEVGEELDWNSPVLKNIGLYNQGESTDNYNFFSYYRFIETFFEKGPEEDQLIELVESVDTTEIIEFAKKHELINENGTAKSLAKELYSVRNSYVHHKLTKVRIFDPTHNIPTPLLLKWRVVTKEIAIQLLNLHGKL